MAFVNKVNGIPIDEFLAVNPNYIKAPALDKYGNPYLFEDGTPQYTVIPKSDEEIPTIDPFSGQQVSAQDQAAFTRIDPDKDYHNMNYFYNMLERLGTDSQYTNESADKIRQGLLGTLESAATSSADQSILQDLISNTNLKLSLLDNYLKKSPEVPTIDPFSGQQVSAQDQAAFTQPQQDIFPTNLDGITSLIDSMGAKPNQFTTEEGYKKIGEDNSARRQSMMDSLSSAYSGIATLATIPATFFQSLVGLDLPGSGFRTEAMEQNLADIISQKGVPQGTIGYEDFGLNFGQEGSVLKNIINNKAGLANALTLGRVGYNVDPSTGKINFSNTEYDFSPGEISFANKFSRPVLEFLSKGGAFGDKPITLNPNVKLSSNDPILNSLTENFNNLSLQQMNQIRNTPREALIEQARSGGQKGGIGYLLGF